MLPKNLLQYHLYQKFGMKQKIGIAQAIIHEPEVLFLDEPASGLDPFGIKNLREIILKINKEKGLGVPFEEELAQAMKDPEFKKAWDEPTGDVYLDTALGISLARQEKKMSQKKLAKKVGTSQQAIARLENPSYRGRSLSTLEKIAQALGKKLEIKFT